jgi:hypothetical protein
MAWYGMVGETCWQYTAIHGKTRQDNRYNNTKQHVELFWLIWAGRGLLCSRKGVRSRCAAFLSHNFGVQYNRYERYEILSYKLNGMSIILFQQTKVFLVNVRFNGLNKRFV